MRSKLLLILILIALSCCGKSNGNTRQKTKTVTKHPPAKGGAAKREISLPKVDHTSSSSLMYALKHRKSQRQFQSKDIPEAVLSSLLWAANGINRPDGKRTSPTLWPLDIYVATKEGLYLWDAKSNKLNLRLKEDMRALTGKQKFTQEAPVNLVFVMDYEKMTSSWLEKLGGKDFYAGNAAGYVSMNVYLYAAANHLATVALAWFDQKALSKKMGLKKTERILLTHPVGYPAK